MPKRGDGNEQDLRVRPKLDSHSLDADNPFYDENAATETHGAQSSYVQPVPGDSDSATYDWTDNTTICPAGFTTRSIDQTIVKILKQHFSLSSNIHDSDLRQYTYSDSHDSKIRIVMNTVWDTRAEGMKPALIVKRGGQQTERQVIGDRSENGESADYITRYTKFFRGTHQVLCIGRTDGQTEALATEVFDLFTCIGPLLYTGDLPFHDFQTSGIGELGIIEELGQSMAVPVVLSYIYEYSWSIRQVAPTLSRSKLDNTSEVVL